MFSQMPTRISYVKSMTCILKHICAPGFYNAAAQNERPVCNEYDAGKNSFFFKYTWAFS